MMMKKKITILNLLLIAATVISALGYMEHGGLLRKGITSGGFVVLGLVNLFYAFRTRNCSCKFPVIMTIGLFLCMLGDISINLDFVTGAVIFALGHLFYFAAYCCLLPLRTRDFLPGVVIFAVATAFITLSPIFNFGSGLMLGVCIGYAAIISFMVGKAIANCRQEGSRLHKLLVLGCALFFFSDLMLVLDLFTGAPHIVDTLCLASYYPAQCLLANSIQHYVIKETNS